MKKNLLLTLIIATFTILSSAQITSAATTIGTGTKQTIIDTLATYDQDSTYITADGVVSVVDLGESAVDDLYKKAAFKKTYTINYLVITHKHHDHVTGLAKLASTANKEKKLVTINALYINGLDFELSGKQYSGLEAIFKSNYVKVKHVYIMGNLNNNAGTKETGKFITYLNSVISNKNKVYNYTSSMDYEYKCEAITKTFGSTNYKLKILPALKNYPKGDLTVNKYENNHSMSAIYYDCNADRKFKFIICGDIETKAIYGIVSDATYSSYFEGSKYTDVYYKVPHHGKALVNVLKKGQARYENEMKLLNIVKPTYAVGTNWAGRDSSNEQRQNFDCYSSFRSDYYLEYPSNRHFGLKSAF